MVLSRGACGPRRHDAGKYWCVVSGADDLAEARATSQVSTLQRPKSSSYARRTPPRADGVLAQRLADYWDNGKDFRLDVKRHLLDLRTCLISKNLCRVFSRSIT